MKALVSLAVAWIAAIVVVVVLVADARTTALDRADRSAAAITQAMEEHTERTLQTVGLTLRAVADAWLLARPPKNDPAFRALMKERLKDLPYVRAIFVIGPDGFITHDSDYPATPVVSLADRDYFRAHYEDWALLRTISAPLMSRTPGAGWFFSVTERIGMRDKFEGIVVAAVQPAFFETVYARMAHGNNETFALFHSDGRLVARHPAAPDQVGSDFRRLPLFSYLEKQGAGGYRVEGHLVPGRRMVAYRTVRGLPFVVHVSLGEAEVLAEWRRSALGAAVAMSALTLLLGGVVWREARNRRRRVAHRASRVQAEKLEALGQLTGGIAHDFNNILGVVSLNVEMIARHPDDPHANARAAAAAARSIAHAKALIARLLAFARRQPLELRPADLNALVAEAHPLVAQAVGSRIEIVLRLAPALPLALTDSAQLEIALLNLVVNARDAMQGRGRITLRTFEGARGEPCLEIEDNGPGMSETVRRRALEPFFTTKGEGGTGLGLAQVYGFMRQADGRVEIDSSPGRGTRVLLAFVRAPHSPSAGATAEAAAYASS